MADETPSRIAAAIKLLADVYAPARQADAEKERPIYATDAAAAAHFTVGYLTGTVGQLLDELGYPETGPDFGPSSRLPTVRLIPANELTLTRPDGPR